MLFSSLGFIVALAAQAPAPEPPEPGFYDDGQLGHYLAWYGAEYLAVIATAGLLGTGATESIEPVPASIGPSFSLADPDLELLFDPRLAGVIDRPILQEKVPVLSLAVVLAAAVLADAGLDLALRRDLHRTHAILLGTAEAIGGAALITEAMKLGVGRLRPDFRERYLRAACGGVVEAPSGLDCASLPNDGFVVDRQDLLYGMKSFPSGHASGSFAIASFLVMQLGSEHLWSSHAPEWARPVAALAVGGLLAGAGYVSATRVSDNRHHLEDVVVGAAIGTASGVAAYLVHFDLDGRARRRGAALADGSIVPMPVAGGAGVAFVGNL